MKKIIALLLVLFCFSSLISLRALAQTPEETDEELIKQKVEERIEKVLDSTDENQKRALVGSIKAVVVSTLTIKTSSGDFQAKVATDATILNLEREEIKLEDLEIGNKVIAMGYFDDQDVLEAKRIVIREELQASDAEVTFGTVTDISQEEKVLTIKHPKTQTVYMVETDSKTEIAKKVDGEIEEIKFSEIEEGDSLVAIGKLGENEEKVVTAKLIHVLSEKTLESSPETEEESPTPSPTSEPEE